MKDSNEPRDSSQATETARQPYTKPQLKVYGSVAKLTTGGSGLSAEGGSGMLGQAMMM